MRRLFGSRHIFLGFTKCGRYVLSYTSDCGEDDDFSFYTYHLYWWEFNLHSRLKQVKEWILISYLEMAALSLYVPLCGIITGEASHAVVILEK